MRTIRYLILFIILIFSHISDMSSNRITLNSISVIDQFPSKSVHRIIQDKDGFLWFGTDDGLCRYDGYNILVFRSDLNNPNLLTNNEITCLHEDNKNNIWIGTKRGLNILNRETLQIIEFPDKKIQEFNIQAVFCDSNGYIWIGVNSHLFRYNPETRKTTEFKNSLINQGQGVSSIDEDHSGNIWVLIWDKGIFKYEKDGKFTSYPPIGEKNIPFKMYQDNNQRYWICTYGDGVYQFDPNNRKSIYKKCVIVNNKNNEEEKIFFSIVQDNTYGYLWLMSLSGIYALHCNKDNQIQQVDVSYLFKKTNNLFNEIIKDIDGNLWIAAYDEGVFSLNFNKPIIYNLPFSDILNSIGVVPNITAIYKDYDNILWINQDRVGLIFYNQKTNKAKTYKDFIDLKNLSFLENVSCLKSFSNTEVWAGAGNEAKIAVIEKNNKDFHLKNIIDLNNHNNAHEVGIKKIFRDNNHNLFVIGQRHVYIKTHQTKKFNLLPSELSNITNITEDQDGNIWMSSSQNGFYRVNINSSKTIPDVKITNYNKRTSKLVSNNIHSICCDKENNVWLGSKEGNIILYNKQEAKFEDYSNELRMTGEAVLDIFADNNNNIWVTTNKKVISYNKSIKSSREYSIYDDLIVNSFRSGSYFIDKDSNMLYFGGNRGLCIFKSPDFEKKNINSKVIISDVSINGQSLLVGLNNNKFEVISQKLALSPDDRNIELSFTTFDYTYQGKVLYAYKMEGVDDDWIYTNRQFAHYNQLKKGNHIFRVKATDENGIWNTQIATLSIYKAPAFYETWWAYTLYILIFLILAYYIYRIIRQRIQLQQELKIAQIEKEKSEELTQVKLKYFTNISHDLLTPLTVISCLIDDIETLLAPEIHQFSIMRANVNRLKRLLRQVLDFRKMESGNMKLRVTNGEISTFIKDIYLNNFIPLFEKKKIDFFFFSEPESILGYFDADKIDKIVYNLLSNALKFTEEGGKIELRLQLCKQSNHNCISIIVADNGIGISSENIKNIFTRFYNDRSIDTGQTNGIGLSLTRDLAELHHGQISVESKENIGSTFTVIIPIDKSFFDESELDNHLLRKKIVKEKYNDIPIELSTSENKIREDINLLLVEDNDQILQTMKNILQKRYNVFTASNGVVAIKEVRDNNIDIIVSDVMMPQLDGLELCRIIKSDINTSDIPILLLTAKSSIEDRIDCYDAGADGYISKPFDLKLLVARINNFLANKKKRQTEFKNNIGINISVLEYPSLDERFLNKAMSIIEEHLSDTSFDLELFSQAMNMSKSSLYRKIKSMTGFSSNDFIRNIRLKHACQMLKDKSITISEVAYATGFSDQRYFAKCFKNEFNMTPSQYQQQ